MKKYMFLLLILMISLSMSAQTKIDSYDSDYFESTFGIYATNGEKLSLYFDIRGESKNDDVMINVDGESTIISFINSLKEVRDKYAEWKKVAVDNKVTDYSKDFDISFPNVYVAWYGTKWWFDFRERFEPYFKVSSDGKCYAVFHSEAVSSSNEYITEKYYWVFSSVKEFDSFIEKIQPQALIEKLNKKNAPDELFK